MCSSDLKSWECNEMEREPARRYRAEGEGVFSSALRKFKSPILGWDGSARFRISYPYLFFRNYIYHTMSVSLMLLSSLL